MSVSLIPSEPRQYKNTKDVLEGRVRRLRARVVKDLVFASGKRGTRRTNGLTVADRLLRHADELASLELQIADLDPQSPGR
jgi:hypothetical protein